jgi:hypothetical protein
MKTANDVLALALREKFYEWRDGFLSERDFKLFVKEYSRLKRIAGEAHGKDNREIRSDRVGRVGQNPAASDSADVQAPATG